MKKAMVIMTSGLFFMFVTCKPQKDIFINPPDSQYVKKGLYPPCVSNCDSTVLFCAEYAYKPANHRKKDVCSCNLCKIELLDWNVSTHSGICNWTRSTIIVWDKKFISDYVLPLVEDEDSRNLIEFTLSHSDDSTFKAENVIDYENKVILNDKMYYYPLKIKKRITVFVHDIEWFKSVVPQSSWIFGSDCYSVLKEKEVLKCILIPILDYNFIE